MDMLKYTARQSVNKNDLSLDLEGIQLPQTERSVIVGTGHGFHNRRTSVILDGDIVSQQDKRGALLNQTLDVAGIRSHRQGPMMNDSVSQRSLGYTRRRLNLGGSPRQQL